MLSETTSRGCGNRRKSLCYALDEVPTKDTSRYADYLHNTPSAIVDTSRSKEDWDNVTFFKGPATEPVQTVYVNRMCLVILIFTPTSATRLLLKYSA